MLSRTVSAFRAAIRIVSLRYSLARDGRLVRSIPPPALDSSVQGAVYFALKDRDLILRKSGRFWYPFLKYFEVAGYSIVLPETRFMYGLLSTRWGRLVLKTNAVMLRDRTMGLNESPPRSFLAGAVNIVDDREGVPVGERALQIIPKSRLDDERPDLIAPFPVHASWLEGEKWRVSMRERKLFWYEDRPVNILFAGNLSPAPYSRPIVHRGMHFLPRARVVSNAVDQIEGSTVTAADEFSVEDIRQSRPGLLIIDSTKSRLPADEWRTALMSSNFFIAPPGTHSPFCHNKIEAMAMGCIPVTEYGDLFDPPLQDGVNSVAFRGVEGLRGALDRAVAARPEEIQRMRENVREYFDHYLSPLGFNHRLERAFEFSSIVCLGVPYTPV